MAESTEIPDQPDPFQVPTRIHYTAFEASAEAAERMGMLLAAQTLRESAEQAKANGGWLE